MNAHALIHAAVREKIPHFAYSSAAAIYASPPVTRVAETAPTRPITPIGWSKLITEQVLEDASLANTMNYCALRYFNVAGADPDGRLGQSTIGATNLIKVAAEAAPGNRDSVPIFGTDYDTVDGTGVRDFIHVTDLAVAHVLALEALVEEQERSLTLNCGYGHEVSVMKVLDVVDQVTNKRLSRQAKGRRAGDHASLIADPTKICQVVNWKPQFDVLATIVTHALRWEQRILENEKG